MTLKRTLQIIVVLVGLAVISVFHFGKTPAREKTRLERESLYCATGITTENRDLLQNELFAIVNTFIAWRDGFPAKFAHDLPPTALLMVTWEPYLVDFDEHSLLYAIAKEREDEVICDFADSCRAYGKPVIVRWGHEMNGNWYPWSGASVEEDSGLYISAYRRIRDIFRKRECTNAKFVFCVNYRDVPAGKWNRFEEYYPGDEYVDFLGMDIYNWGNIGRWGWWFWSRSRWTAPEDLLEKPYERMIRLSPDKPVLLCEVGSTSSGGDKREWIQEFFGSLKTDFTAVKGFVWFDFDKETDWGISIDTDMWETYRAMSGDEYFKTDYRGLEVFR